MGAAGMVGGVLNMVTGIAGNNIQQLAGIEGAQLNADIQRRALAFQDKILDEQIARLKPYWEEGKSAIETLTALDAAYGSPLPHKDNMVGVSDDTKTTLSKAREFMDKENEKRDGGFGESQDDRLYENALIAGRDIDRAKAMDYTKVGMGAADQSGAFTPDHSNQLMSIGNTLAQANQKYETGIQNAITRAIDQGSGIPAYMSYGGGAAKGGEGAAQNSMEYEYGRF